MLQLQHNKDRTQKRRDEISKDASEVGLILE